MVRQGGTAAEAGVQRLLAGRQAESGRALHAEQWPARRPRRSRVPGVAWVAIIFHPFGDQPMFTTYYRVKRGENVLGDGGTTKEIQGLLADADPGEYAVDVVTRDTPHGDGDARPWGKAIKHADGMVHLE